jgi:hypothetical protein
MLSWTTTLAARGSTRERTLPGVVLDAASLDGVDLSRWRTSPSPVVLEAVGAGVLLDSPMPDLVEFLDLAARALRSCAAHSVPWTAMVVQVRAESGSISAHLVDHADPFARAGAAVMLTLASLEEAAWAMPPADEDPDGFSRAEEALKTQLRAALRAAAAADPARTALAEFRSATGCDLLLDLVGQFDVADFEPLVAR